MPECKTPGEKIRSKGLGRGAAVGRGRGPIGIPIKKKKYKKQMTTKEAYDAGVELALRILFS